METAPRTAVQKNPSTGPRRRTRRGLSPATVVVAVLIAIAALGTMAVALAGIWPPKGTSGEIAAGDATPTALTAAGLIVQKASEDATRQGDQVTVKVRVTNNVKQVPVPTGTPTPGVNPTPGPPEPATILHATIRVTFYDDSNNIVGTAFGSVLNLPYGQSTDVTVTGTGIGDFSRWDAAPDAMWTNKGGLNITPSQPLHLARGASSSWG